MQRSRGVPWVRVNLIKQGNIVNDVYSAEHQPVFLPGRLSGRSWMVPAVLEMVMINTGFGVEDLLATAEIQSGICGFTTVVEATADGRVVNLDIKSDCKAIQKLAEDLKQVDPFQEISFRRSVPQVIQMGMQHCSHAACPVPVGIIKAIEVEANLALPADVSIKLFKSED